MSYILICSFVVHKQQSIDTFSIDDHFEQYSSYNEHGHDNIDDESESHHHTHRHTKDGEEHEHEHNHNGVSQLEVKLLVLNQNTPTPCYGVEVSQVYSNKILISSPHLRSIFRPPIS